MTIDATDGMLKQNAILPADCGHLFFNVFYIKIQNEYYTTFL